MTKRVVAAFLWFYAGWYAGAMIAGFLGINPVFGPILGAAAAGLIVADPSRIIWSRPESRAMETAPAEVKRPQRPESQSQTNESRVSPDTRLS